MRLCLVFYLPVRLTSYWFRPWSLLLDLALRLESFSGVGYYKVMNSVKIFITIKEPLRMYEVAWLIILSLCENERGI